MNDRLHEILRGVNPAPPARDEEAEADGEDLGPCVSSVSARRFPGFLLKHARVIGEDRRTTRVVNYSHLGLFDFPDDERKIILEWHEPEKWRGTITGLCLPKLVTRLNRNVVEWIKPVLGNASRFPDKAHIFIEDITIQRIEDEE